MYSEGVTDENYLRGVQETDADGRVTFTTIFPACYAGRWPHMHFEVYQSLDAATQLQRQAAHLAARDARGHVRARSTARRRLRRQRRATSRRVSLDTDRVFSDGYSLQLRHGDRVGRRGLHLLAQRAGVRQSGEAHMVRCRPPCPTVTRPRATARSRTSALAGARRAAVRVLRARAVLHGAVRLLRLQHLHRRRARRTGAPGASRTTYAEAAVAEVRLARRVLGDARPGRDRLLRRRYADPAGACGPRRGRSRAIDDEFGLADGRRGDHRGEPRQRRRVRTSSRCARRASTGSRSACSRRSTTCSHVLDRTHDPAAGPGRRRLGAGGRLRAGQPRPDLRHAGGVARPTGRPRSTPRWRARPTTSRRTP